MVSPTSTHVSGRGSSMTRTLLVDSSVHSLPLFCRSVSPAGLLSASEMMSHATTMQIRQKYTPYLLNNLVLAVADGPRDARPNKLAR